jgi:uncharacterized protein (DUF885 family)
MKKSIALAIIILILGNACKNATTTNTTEKSTSAKSIIDSVYATYYEDRLKLFPLDATTNGDSRYNNLLPIDFTNTYKAELLKFYTKNLNTLKNIDPTSLSDEQKSSYNIFKREMEMSIEGLGFTDNYIPANQFWGLPLTMGQLGSGDGNQPFKTVSDYQNWLQRITAFTAWTDSAILYFKKGMATNYVLPQSLVIKMIPQLESMVTNDATKSLFYGPIAKMPKEFTAAEKQKLTTAYTTAIKNELMPAYKKLATFIKQEYLPKARTSNGISALPNGNNYYQYLIKYWTTTNKTPEEIYQIGLGEVARIKGLMDSVKKSVNFTGDLTAFFEYMKNDAKFMPYKNSAQVLKAFADIQQKIDPKLKNMFGNVPKTKFEIRQTEAFRAASASAEYNQGTADGSRPGIFYVPIIDATKFNTTSGMESLFLHEAIPGHHYQISLQQENEKLPKFLRYNWYGAYGEGWALYCESLGKELGCYTDPYQYMGALGDEMHRAIRLVVDVALHTKNMTREEAIKYMMDNEAIGEQGATAEIERYMAIPGQALSYKIGALKIKELREKYTKQLGSKFNLSAFHDEFLKNGCMPLDVLETQMDAWAKKQ